MLSPACTRGNCVPDAQAVVSIAGGWVGRLSFVASSMNFRVLTLALLSLVLVRPPLWAETPGELASGLLTELTKGGTCGLAVAVARDGQILYQGGYGYADVA